MKTQAVGNQIESGFALVVTLTLMVLLTILAVGLLTLSTVTFRSTSAGEAGSVARNNAKLAMMLAIGELQAGMGPDRSVSAPASSVTNNAAQPHLTGVWQHPVDSPINPVWHWTPAVSGSPSYSGKSALFKNWLVSSATPTATGSIGFATEAPPTGATAVALVGNPDTDDLEDSSGNPISVAAEKVRITDVDEAGKIIQKGNIAWAVFDESIKAPIHLGDPATAQSSGTEIASRTVPSRVHAEVLNTAKLSSLEDPVNLVSLSTAVIPAGKANADEFRKRFHDLTTGSLGLLTDTANGGLKTDLTSVFEANSNISPGGTLSPYPNSFSAAMGAPRWTYIRDHYRKYKNLLTASGTPNYKPVAGTDLKISNAQGTNTSPTEERLIPVIAKLQMVFSIVSHNAHFGDRVAYYEHTDNTAAAERPTPKGNANHAVPHLAYDPVITLHNPYDVALQLDRFRVRIWDPPVGFKFTKIPAGQAPAPYRDANFHHIGTFTHTTDRAPATRKMFTLVLTDGTTEAAGNSLSLLPGEVKVFSARVELDWTWGKEVASGSNRSFFDYDANANFANQERRPPALWNVGGLYGVEAVPGWYTTAGLQTDHLSWSPRPAGTLYDFEKNKYQNAGFVSIRVTDEIKVEAKPLKSPAGDFQVDVLAGRTSGMSPTADLLRTYKFTFADIAAEIAKDPTDPIIERQYVVAHTLQPMGGEQKGWKKPFAILEMSARTTKGDLTDSKPWLYNNHIVEGSTQVSSQVGLANQSYDVRLYPTSSFDSFPDGITLDPATRRGYFGAGDFLENGGSSFVPMLHVPVAPAASLGDLIPSNLVSGSNLPRVVHPFGNSRAHPLIAKANATSNVSGLQRLIDHSYLLNDTLWDKYYFSSIADYSSVAMLPTGDRLDREDVLTNVLNGTKPALNTRLTAAPGAGKVATITDEFESLSDSNRSLRLARYLAINGPFNVNSSSVDAWRAVLSSLRGRSVNGLNGNGASSSSVTSLSAEEYETGTLTPFVRTAKPLAGPDADGNLKWAGFRALSDTEIESLAQDIVTEINNRGTADQAPPFSVGEFVNRRLASSGVHNLAGILQTAIDNSSINDDARGEDSKKIGVAGIPLTRRRNAVTTEAMEGYTGEGAPTMLTQGDLMAALAPIITVRGDTFKIRSYGEATAADGKTVIARAWCEAVVQRIPDFVDPSEPPETPQASLNETSNLKFGRRFNIVSFRWMNKDEI